MADNTKKIEDFVTVTGVDETRAKFFLDSCNWDLDLAVSRFLDGEEAGGDDVEVLEPMAAEVQREPRRSDSDSPPPLPASQASIKTTKRKPDRTNAKFATLNTLNNSSDEEEDGQAFYAGGSEHSGQQVLGPSKKKDFVADMFKSVKEHGVEVVDETGAGSSRFFKGTGYKLGQTDNDTEVVAGAPEPSQPTEVTMRLWREGFSLDEGPLRSYSDPSNRDFLESIRRGEIPQELRQGASEINLSMEDRRGEAFKQKQGGSKGKLFSGKGHTLGNPTPPTVGAPAVVDQPVNEAHAREVLNVNRSAPLTNLQIRLADGSRLVGEFNHDNTVGQVRSYIVAARPQYETRSFDLLSTFPSRVLDDAQTIKDAGILNSAIMQKLN